MYLIELGGDRQFVESLDGCDGATIMWEGTDPPEDPAAQLIDGQWVVPIDVLKARKWDGVKAQRDARENGMAPTAFGTVQCDEKSKQKINGMVTMAMIANANSLPFNEPFTMADNSVVSFDGTTAIQMGVQVGQFISAVYARGRELRELIDAASSAAELDSIDVTAGWP